MRRPILAVVSALALTALAAPVANAGLGNPNYRSIVQSMSPKPAGVRLDVLSFDDELQVTNHSKQPLTVDGYNGEPYVQLLADGTVQVNQHSPAAYLNDQRSEEGITVPKDATPTATPLWKTIDKTGVYQWHDHRIHYMASGTPPQVTDKSKRTKVFDWTVPVKVGATPGAIKGQLVWVGKNNSGPPVAAILGLVVLVLLGGGAVVAVRRRRSDDDDDGEGGYVRPAQEAREAW